MPFSQGQLLKLIAEQPDPLARITMLRGQPAVHTYEAIEQMHAEVLRLAYIDAEQASRLAQAAQWLAVELGEPRGQALALRALAHTEYAQSNHEAALAHYSESLRLFEELGQDLEAGRTLNSGLQTLIYLGRYEQAYEWAERARVIFIRHGDHLRLARLASNMGNILYRQDRHADALELYGQAYEKLKSIGESKDVAAVLSNMAVCCTSLSRFPQALEYYNLARHWCEDHGLDLLVAGADYNIAYLHYLRGDYLKAMEIYQATRVRCEKVHDRYHAALCDLDESEMFLELNLSDEAGILARQAAQSFQVLSMPYERAKAMVNRAIAASHRGERARVHSLFRDARKLFGSEGNTIWPALIDLYEAILYHQHGRNVAARRLCERAYKVLADSLLPGKAALCELLRAQLFLKAGKRTLARQSCLDAMNRIASEGAPSLRFHAHFVLGLIEEHCGNTEAAYMSYLAAREEIEQLRSRLWGEDMKIWFLKDKLVVYESLVALCLGRVPQGQESVREALLNIERAKSRSLMDMMSIEAPAIAGIGEQPGYSPEIEEMRRDLNWHYRQIDLAALLAQSGFAQRIQTLLEKAREREKQLVRTMAEVPAPDAGANVPLEKIQASIPANAILLEYYQVRGVIHVCLIGRDRLEVVPLAAAPELRTQLRLLQFQLSKFRLSPAYLQLFGDELRTAVETNLSNLYRNLIEPVRARLNASHLIISPHSFLHHLPFHALVGGGRNLIDDFTISYAPSASVFSLCRARKQTFREESLVLGVPDSLAPHIESEALSAAEVLPNARLFIGEEANEQNLRQFGSTARYVHIATHGLYRRDNPMFSSIRLSGSHLSLFDLYQLPISADLVTLSGCSTGLNAVVGGDELLGLMRGLLFAGAHTVNVSLWDVNDQSTAQFMSSFYLHLKKESNKAVALQQAMLELRAEYPHPYYWAPFVLVGNYGG